MRACSQREGDRQRDRDAVTLISERERERETRRAKRGGGVGCCGRSGVGRKMGGHAASHRTRTDRSLVCLGHMIYLLNLAAIAIRLCDRT